MVDSPTVDAREKVLTVDTDDTALSDSAIEAIARLLIDHADAQEAPTRSPRHRPPKVTTTQQP
jgi:hypothetical protein